MPTIQFDVQPLTAQQRAELRKRTVAAVARTIGSPDPYISVLIREYDPTNLVEAGGSGPYDDRQLIRQPGEQSVGSGDRS